MSIHPDFAAVEGRHRFTISTKHMQDLSFETPVSGATQIVTARSARGRLDAYSIGSDGHVHHFTRDGADLSRSPSAGAAERWTHVRLPWKASALAVVPQRGGTDKVFFAQLDSGVGSDGGKEKTATVYELESAGGEPQRRLLGRFTTTDPKVYGLRELCGVQCRDGSNILVTALAAIPARDTSNWTVLFGHGSSTGVLSLGEGKGLVATKAVVASEDPGSTRWPHMTFVLLHHGELRVEWGSASGVLLQSERLALPDLPDVIDLDVARDHGGKAQIVALDRDHRLHVLSQIGGGESRPPRWADSWLLLDSAQDDGSLPPLRRVHALRRGDGDLEIFALDTDDRLWSITERSDAQGSDPERSDPERSDPERSTRWGRLRDLGVHAAHIAVGSPTGEAVEVFAVSRQNQLLWLRKSPHGGDESWRVERIGWSSSRSTKAMLNVYRTGLTILDEDHGAVPGVPVAITANERLPSTVNGLSYLIGPAEPVVGETNAFGKISVTFELADRRSVPSLSFEAGFLAGGLLDVCPRRKAHLYVESVARDELARGAGHRAKMYLIPEDTVIEQG